MMSASTESFWVADIRKTDRIRQSSAATSSSFSATESIADLAKAGLLSLPAVDTTLPMWWMEIGARALRSLRRPAQSQRTADEVLSEERLNTFTHGTGLALSGAGVAFLLMSLLPTAGLLQLASCLIYGGSLVAMFAASTLYHMVHDRQAKLRFQLCDHVAIYLLIAGSYTPFLAAFMPGLFGYVLLACVWVFALFGIANKLKYAGRLEETSPLPCLALGWIGLVGMKPMLSVMPAGCLALVLAGGLSYSIGVVFYCRDDKRYFHTVWHLFVIVGTGLHYAAIAQYVAA